MAIKEKQPRNKNYDWTEIAAVCVHSPGKWYCEDDPKRPTTSAHSIKRGIPRVFGPPGTFDAVSRRDGLYVRYLGVPIDPWYPWMGDARSFNDLQRTVDPSEFPADTPAEFTEFAARNAPES